MILEFVQPFGAWKTGDTASESAPGTPISESLGRALIAQGVAKEVNELTALRSTLLAEQKRQHEELLALARGNVQTKSTPQGPPNGGGAVDFTRISATSVPAEEQDEKRSFGDAMRHVAMVHCVDADPAVHNFSRRRMRVCD